MTYQAALITGASSGIGEAIARALPASTALWLTGRNEDRLTALAATLAAQGRQVAVLAADLATPAGVTAVIDWVQPAGLDLLVNNAGFGRFGFALEDGDGADDAMVKLNVLAPLTLTQALVPPMIARTREQGRRAGLIYVASTIAFFSMPFLATYSASKSFLLSYAEALGAELRREPIDILALCPGVTRTRFLERARIPLPAYARVETPERVAREALAALGRKPAHVVGHQGRLATFLPRLLPRRVTTALLARMAETWQ